MSTKEDIIPSFTIHDKLCAKTKCMNAKWVNGSVLSVFAFQNQKFNSVDKPTKYANTDPVIIHHLKTQFIFDEPILRCLLAESNSVFQELQQQITNGDNVNMIKISKTYRSIIRSNLQKLQKIVEHDDDHLCHNYITIFYSIECLWHLCEIFMIDSLHINSTVPHLIDWVRFHFPAAEQRATEMIFGNDDESDIDDKEYLKIIKLLVAQGHLDVARTILQLYGRNNFSACYQMTEEVLKSIPVYNVTGGLSLKAWRSQWQYWLADTEAKLQMGCFEGEPEMKEIIELLTGNECAWYTMAKESSCWYEYFPGYLFYTQPNCTYYQLGALAENWIRQWNFERNEHNATGNNLKHVDRVVLKIMQNDLYQVLHDIQHMCDQQWFATHLTDLLYRSGKLQNFGHDQRDHGLALRNSLLFDFGAMLMSKESFWIFGVDYLGQCSIEESAAIELFLTKIIIHNEKQAMKIINVARNRGYSEVEKEICRVQAMKSFKNGRFGNTLDWALRSQCATLVTSIADMFLNHYSKTGEILCEDVILSIGAKMFISPRLVFLVKYYDFQNLYRREQYPQAAELLVNLLDSKISPGYFWPTMFADTIPMLEAVDPIFSSKDTYKIMYHLENQLVPLLEKYKKILNVSSDGANGTSINWSSLLQKATGHFDETTTKRSLVEKIQFMVQLIRRSCTRNLSRAIIIEK